jgi:hypothetical protein
VTGAAVLRPLYRRSTARTYRGSSSMVTQHSVLLRCLGHHLPHNQRTTGSRRGKSGERCRRSLWGAKQWEGREERCKWRETEIRGERMKRNRLRASRYLAELRSVGERKPSSYHPLNSGLNQQSINWQVRSTALTPHLQSPPPPRFATTNGGTSDRG